MKFYSVWGYASTSRIARSWAELFKVGLKEWPEIYLGLAHVLAGSVALTYMVYKEERDRNWVVRFKKNYIIYRPNDPRLALYPTSYVTDSKYLPPNHPKTPLEVNMYYLPPLDVHKGPPPCDRGVIATAFGLGKM